MPLPRKINGRRIRNVVGKGKLRNVLFDTYQALMRGDEIFGLEHQILLKLLHRNAVDYPDIDYNSIIPYRFILKPPKTPEEKRDFSEIMKLSKRFDHELYLITTNNGQKFYVISFH